MGKGGKSVPIQRKGANTNKLADPAPSDGEKVTDAKDEIAGQTDFHWEATDEPHATRRQLMLAKYPEIKKLYGHDPASKWKALAGLSLILFLAIWTRNKSWLVWFSSMYCVGAVMSQMLMMAMHECSHSLFFKKLNHNKWFGIFVNTGLVVPSAITFKRYHMEHHRYQGEDIIDVDIPTEAEGKFFNTPLRKFFFVFFQMFFYGLRPLFINPKRPNSWQNINLVIVLGFDYLLYHFFGIWPLVFLLCSDLFGSGVHPIGAHFISEHYVFTPGHETYSYYGFWNYFLFNVGYHNEHHDFPYIPGSRLYRLREIAPEFYDTLPQHESFVKVIYDYIMNPNITAFSRIKRRTMTKEQREKLQAMNN